MHSFLEVLQIFFLETIAVTSAFILTYTDYNRVGTYLREMSEKLNFSDLGVNALYEYSKIKVQWTKYWAKSYEEQWTTRVVVDSTDYLGRYFYSLVNGTLLEPYDTRWIAVCILSRDPENFTVTLSSASENRKVNLGWEYKEKYQTNGDLPLSETLHTYNVWNTVTPEYLQDHDHEIVLILKSDGKYLSRVSLKDRTCKSEVGGDQKSKPHSPDVFTPTRMQLIISVEYTHPRMNEGIMLDVPREFMNVGNEILSPAFVYRCLKYQNKPFYFDMDYTVKILDSFVSASEVKSDEMVVFEKTGFQIVKL